MILNELLKWWNFQEVSAWYRAMVVLSRSGSCWLRYERSHIYIYIYYTVHIIMYVYNYIWSRGLYRCIIHLQRQRERETIQHRMCIWSWYVEILQMYIHLLSRYNLFIYVYWCTWYWHGLYHKHLCYTSTYAAPLDGIHTRSFNVAMENHNFQ